MLGLRNNSLPFDDERLSESLHDPLGHPDCVFGALDVLDSTVNSSPPKRAKVSSGLRHPSQALAHRHQQPVATS